MNSDTEPRTKVITPEELAAEGTAYGSASRQAPAVGSLVLMAGVSSQESELAMIRLDGILSVLDEAADR